MSDRTFDLVDHRYPHGHFGYPAMANVIEAPFHESTTPQDKLQATDAPTVIRTWTVTNVVTGERRCSACRVWLLLSRFSRNIHMALGREYVCRTCKNERNREYREKKRAA